MACEFFSRVSEIASHTHFCMKMLCVSKSGCSFGVRAHVQPGLITDVSVDPKAVHDFAVS